MTVVDTNVTFPLVWLNSFGHGDKRNEVTGYSEICLQCYDKLRTSIPIAAAPARTSSTIPIVAAPAKTSSTLLATLERSEERRV